MDFSGRVFYISESLLIEWRVSKEINGGVGRSILAIIRKYRISFDFIFKTKDKV